MGYKIENNRIYLTRGDSFPCSVSMIDETTGLNYIPQEGDKVRFALKRAIMTPGNKEFVDEEPLILKDIPNETLILELDPEDTSGLPFGSYKYDIEITFANGRVDTFIQNADFILTPEVH